MQLVGIIPGVPGYLEIVVVLMVGLLLFGRRLPEIGRSVGRTIVEFKKGIREVKDDVSAAASSNPPPTIDPPPASTTGQSGNTAAVDGGGGASTSPADKSATATPSTPGDQAPPAQN